MVRNISKYAYYRSPTCVFASSMTMPVAVMFQEEYVAGAVSSFLGSKKPKETGDGGSTSHLFRPEAASTSSTDLNALKVL